MLAERRPRPTIEMRMARTITQELESGKKVTFPDQERYGYEDVANALGRPPRSISTQLHNKIKNNPSILFTTLRELKMLGMLNTSEVVGRPQTIRFDRPNFIRVLNIVDAPRSPRKKSPKPNVNISLISKDTKPKKPRSSSNSFWNNVNLSREDRPKPPIPLKEMLHKIKDPKQILAINSVLEALSHLAKGRLQEITHDLKEFLKQVATEHVQIVRFQGDPPQGILKQILDSDSQNRLNRFFRVNLEAMLYDLRDLVDNESRAKEEKEIIEICKELKKKGYDQKRVAQEIFSHFQIPK